MSRVTLLLALLAASTCAQAACRERASPLEQVARQMAATRAAAERGLLASHRRCRVLYRELGWRTPYWCRP